MTRADDAGGPLSADERASLIAAHERRVDAMRNSAQYRVGELVIAAARSPRRLVRLPVDAVAAAQGAARPASRSSPPPPRHRATGPRRQGCRRSSTSSRTRRWRRNGTSTPSPRPKAADQLADDRPGTGVRRVGVGGQRRGVPLRARPLRQARAVRPSRDVLSAAAAPGIPTAFWNKEDPVHFDTFAPAAARFDWIFTTDADCVAPLPRAGRARSGRRTPVRRPATDPQPDRRLRAATRAGVLRRELAGRQLRRTGRRRRDAAPSGARRRPARHLRSHGRAGCHRCPLPAPYDQGGARRTRRTPTCSRDYRRYACFLNVNSVKSSPTMCSRRVFELLACRTPVVSTPIAGDRRVARRRRDHGRRRRLTPARPSSGSSATPSTASGSATSATEP